jgi:hypothetical protein
MPKSKDQMKHRTKPAGTDELSYAYARSNFRDGFLIDKCVAAPADGSKNFEVVPGISAVAESSAAKR